MSTSPSEIPKVITHVGTLSKDRRLTTLTAEEFIPDRIQVASHSLADPDKLQKLVETQGKAPF